MILCFFAKVRKRRPETRLHLQYDKLYINNEAYVFNEDSNTIELLNQPELEDFQVNVFNVLSRLGKRDPLFSQT